MLCADGPQDDSDDGSSGNCVAKETADCAGTRWVLLYLLCKANSENQFPFYLMGMMIK